MVKVVDLISIAMIAQNKRNFKQMDVFKTKSCRSLFYRVRQKKEKLPLGAWRKIIFPHFTNVLLLLSLMALSCRELSV